MSAIDASLVLRPEDPNPLQGPAHDLHGHPAVAEICCPGPGAA